MRKRRDDPNIKHRLLSQKTQVLYPTPTWRLTTVWNSNSRGSKDWCTDIHTSEESSYTYNTKIIILKDETCLHSVANMQHQADKAPFNRLKPVYSSNILVPKLFIWRGWRNRFHLWKKGKKSTPNTIKFLFIFPTLTYSNPLSTNTLLSLLNDDICSKVQHLLWGRQTCVVSDCSTAECEANSPSPPQRHYIQSFNLDTTSTWVTEIEYSCYQC